VFILVIRELREWVNWTRRWRDCSRAFIWSWFREVILLCPFALSIFGVVW